MPIVIASGPLPAALAAEPVSADADTGRKSSETFWIDRSTHMTEQETIAVLGAGGTMGQAMAANLLGAGYIVRAWNRSRDKAVPLADHGAVICDSASDAAQGATIILTMLSDADAVLDAVSSIDSRAGENPVWLQMSTIGEAGHDRCANLARERGLTLVDAPVSGTKQPAEEGKLVILASGPEEVTARVDPIFDVVGQKTVWIGPAGGGTRMKVAVNAWLLAVVEGAAETLALAEGLGLDPHQVLEAISGGPLDTPYLQLKGKAMVERSFDPSFSLKLATKDAGLIVDSAEAHGLDLPLFTTIHQRFEQGVADRGDEDLSATFLTSAASLPSA
jgi:3-hydroxyisobutyrate dehydrogenase